MYCRRGAVLVIPYKATSNPKSLSIHSALNVESDAFASAVGSVIA